MSSSKGSTMVEWDGLKKNAMEYLSFLSFTITLCSTLSYLSLLQAYKLKDVSKSWNVNKLEHNLMNKALVIISIVDSFRSIKKNF